jgi:hypothetical protein
MVHVNRGATSLGVFPEEQIREGLRNRRFLPSDLGWREGMANWQPLSQFSEFAAELSAAAAGPPPQTIAASTAPSAPAPSPAGGKTEPLAIWSLVLSIVSLLCCGFVLGVPGVVCGHLALSNIRKDPSLQGRGMALAGVIIGYVGIGLWLIYVIFFGGAAVLQGIRESMSK